MSDRSYAQVVIHDCPPEQRAAALAALAAYEGGIRQRFDWPEATKLAIGERYGYDEADLDSHDQLTAALMAAAPGASFAVWVDPKYEYPGVLTMYTPALGECSGLCDADGEPYAERRELAAIIAIDDRAEREAALDRAVGNSWYRALHPEAVAPAPV